MNWVDLTVRIIGKHSASSRGLDPRAFVHVEDQRSEKPDHLYEAISSHVFVDCMDIVRQRTTISPVLVVVPDNVAREVPIIPRVCISGHDPRADKYMIRAF